MQQYHDIGAFIIAVVLLVLIRKKQTAEANFKRLRAESLAREKQEEIERQENEIKAAERAERRRLAEEERAERNLAIMEAEIAERTARDKAEKERQEKAIYAAEQRKLRAQALAARTVQLESQIQNGFYSWLASIYMEPPSPPYPDELIAKFMNSNGWPLPPDAGLLRSSQHPFVVRCIRCANSFPAPFIPTVR